MVIMIVVMTFIMNPQKYEIKWAMMADLKDMDEDDCCVDND